MMATTVAGRQVCKSTRTTNKQLAKKLLAGKLKFLNLATIFPPQVLHYSKIGLTNPGKDPAPEYKEAVQVLRGKAEDYVHWGAFERNLC